MKEFPDRVKVLEDAQAVIDQSDWVILATPPGGEATEAIYGKLKFREEQNIVCLIAGVKRETMCELVLPATNLTQAFPLPPAEHAQSSTAMFPPHPPTEHMLGKLGRVIPCPDYEQAMTFGVMGCVMGDFYAHLRACHEWLAAKGIEPELASTAVGSYFATFSHASLAAGGAGFQALVDEQTPGGMNESVITELAAGGRYDQMKTAMDNVLSKLMGN